MKEIGGYLELDEYCGREYYENAMAVNCGRSAAILLIQIRGYSKIYIPDFMCSTLRNSLDKYGIEYEHYTVNDDLEPVIDADVAENEAVFIVNYYGLLRNKLGSYHVRWKNIIVDNTQDFFFCYDKADNLYSCRKYFGVADGGYIVLSGDHSTAEYDKLKEDESYARMNFVLGRYERSASEFYAESSKNNSIFTDMPVMKMSKLTHNLMRAIDYGRIAKCRTENFMTLHNELGGINELKNITVPEGAFMYPLMIESGETVRKKLQENKIFVPKLWPTVYETPTAKRLADNIVPLPCDQRYNAEDMKYIIEKIKAVLPE